MQNQPLPSESAAAETRTRDSAPDPPSPIVPEGDDEQRALWGNVHNALFALPAYFRSDLSVSGVLATDLFTFNSSLGATIEAQMVDALNELRSQWDPGKKYPLYRFVRQAQRFPDVILRASAPDVEPAILLGIELKGWYVLAKEREPSFRYKVSPAVCAPWDLLVVYPWALSNVISGSPRLFQPYVIGARYAAKYRNWHWRHAMTGRSDKTILPSAVSNFYPAKTEMISDVPKSDAGRNFGRFARSGLMDGYMEDLFRETLAGIPLSAWQKFLALFTEDWTEEQVTRALDRIATETARARAALSPETVDAIKSGLSRIVQALEAQ